MAGHVVPREELLCLAVGRGSASLWRFLRRRFAMLGHGINPSLVGVVHDVRPVVNVYARPETRQDCGWRLSIRKLSTWFYCDIKVFLLGSNRV